MANKRKHLSTLGFFTLLGVGVWSGYDRLSTPVVDSPPAASANDTQVRPLASAQTAVASTRSGLDGTESLAQLEAELLSLRKRLQAERRQNARQAQEIEYLSGLLANDEVEVGLECGDVFEEEPLAAENSARQALDAQRSADYEDRLAAEPLDTEGSDRVQRQIGELLTDQGMESSVLADAECSESLCRIELQHSEIGAQRAFIDLSPMLLERSPESFIELVEYEDGRKGAVLFLSKSGLDFEG